MLDAGGARREWWKLVPHDELVSAEPGPKDGVAGYAYCLAEPGRRYVVYCENTRSTQLKVGGSADATYRITRFDPRTGERVRLDPREKGGKTLFLPCPDTEDWVFDVVRTGSVEDAVRHPNPP